MVSRRTNWERGQREWLSEGEVPADTLRDLRPDRDALSVWEVGEQTDIEVVDRVVAALAAGRERLDRFHCLLIDEAYVRALDIAIEESEGQNCADEEVKASRHRDLMRLSAEKVAQLAAELWRRAAHCRHGETSVARLIVRALHRGSLRRRDVSPKVMEKLESRFGLGGDIGNDR